MATMQEIETKAKEHALARNKLFLIVTLLQAQIEDLKRAHMGDLKKAINKAAQTGDELLALVNKSPSLFVKPKSVIFHGIKLGFKKEKGKIEFDNPDQVIKLIRKHLPELADTLIITSEKPAKEALSNLSATDLKKLGVNVTSDTDVVFIAPTDSDVDKMVTALIKGADEVKA